MNKKGYALIELIITLFIFTMFFSLVLGFPANLYQDHVTYKKGTKITNEIALLRTAITQDMDSNIIEVIDTNNLMIGNNKYNFGEQVTRENNGNIINITNRKYKYEITGNILKIYNDDVNLEYSVNSSFTKDKGDNNGE